MLPLFQWDSFGTERACFHTISCRCERWEVGRTKERIWPVYCRVKTSPEPTCDERWTTHTNSRLNVEGTVDLNEGTVDLTLIKHCVV